MGKKNRGKESRQNQTSSGMTGMTMTSKLKKVIKKRRRDTATVTLSQLSPPSTTQTLTTTTTTTATKKSTTPKNNNKLSKLQQRMRDKLEGAEFRRLNEELYTQPGHESLMKLQSDTNLFNIYHTGYAKQVTRWPSNPLDEAIGYLRNTSNNVRGCLTVADLGCGQAKLASELSHLYTIHSFDLVACNHHVIACDIANTPLDDSSVDIVLFCLSLMGTNYAQFIAEAWRILKRDGILLIAEVASRFQNHNPRNGFIKGVESVGFKECTEHPFVKRQFRIDGTCATTATATTENHNGGNNQKKKKNKRKAKGNKKSTATDFNGHENRTSDEEKQTDGSGQGSSAFFVKMAFKSTKTANCQNVDLLKNLKNLPALSVCLYKRR